MLVLATFLSKYIQEKEVSSAQELKAESVSCIQDVTDAMLKMGTSFLYDLDLLNALSNVSDKMEIARCFESIVTMHKI